MSTWQSPNVRLMTADQRLLLLDLANQRGMSALELDVLCQEKVGLIFAYLYEDQASIMITCLLGDGPLRTLVEQSKP